MNTPARIASVSLDLDNLWSYLKIHGDPGWVSRPSYLDTFVPYVLDLLERLDLKITFFVVGADAAAPENREALRAIVAAGHEIGNHSYEHEPWLHTYTPQQLSDEIRRTDEAIRDACGVQPVGFRGPGFSWCPELLEVLAERGHRFDASTLPTFLGPIARAYYFRTAKLSAEERELRAGLFGEFADGLRPNAPYRWALAGGRRLLEIPVTTIPGVRTPFHFSYLAWLAKWSEPLMALYLNIAILGCRATGTQPSFLLHPLDVIGGDQLHQLAFFPGMDVPSARKVELLERVLGTLRRHWTLVPMGEHARRLEADPGLPVRQAA
ncbi:MAG: polysaccharide deacetylase [Burkholderiales bacterium]|nr:MAG: polysaccharide deacetylase [Burkholderiales bacterium]